MSLPRRRRPESRLKHIFPGGFDAQLGIASSISCNGSHFLNKTEQMYYMLIECHDPDKPIESITVKSAWYGKQTRAAEHEFILVQFEDTDLGITNYLVLDRNVSNHQGSLKTSSQTTKAVDTFKVSFDGNLKKLLQECDLMPYKFLESLSFPSDEPLRLYELVTLAKVVSGQYPDYHVLDSSCYLYSGVIWECMRLMRPSAVYKDALAKKRGKCRWLRYRPNSSVTLEAHREIDAQLPGIKGKLEERRNVSFFEPLDFRNMLSHTSTP
jgi:hypothetical protein